MFRHCVDQNAKKRPKPVRASGRKLAMECSVAPQSNRGSALPVRPVASKLLIMRQFALCDECEIIDL